VDDVRHIKLGYDRRNCYVNLLKQIIAAGMSSSVALSREIMCDPWVIKGDKSLGCVEIKTNAMCRPEQILSECSVHPITCHEGTEEKWRYSCTFSLTLVLNGGGWLMPSPIGFTLRHDPVCICKRLGGPHRRCWALIPRSSSL